MHSVGPVVLPTRRAGLARRHARRQRRGRLSNLSKSAVSQTVFPAFCSNHQRSAVSPASREAFATTSHACSSLRGGKAKQWLHKLRCRRNLNTLLKTRFPTPTLQGALQLVRKLFCGALTVLAGMQLRSTVPVVRKSLNRPSSPALRMISALRLRTSTGGLGSQGHNPAFAQIPHMQHAAGDAEFRRKHAKPNVTRALCCREFRTEPCEPYLPCLPYRSSIPIKAPRQREGETDEVDLRQCQVLLESADEVLGADALLELGIASSVRRSFW